MAMGTRLAGALSRGLLATAVVSAMAVVVACGSVSGGPGSHPGTSAGSTATPAGSTATPAGSTATPGGSAASAAVPLCVATAHLDRMVVGLSTGLMQGHLREAQPGGVIIADPARVRAVAAALCRLPVMGRPTWSARISTVLPTGSRSPPPGGCSRRSWSRRPAAAGRCTGWDRPGWHQGRSWTCCTGNWAPAPASPPRSRWPPDRGLTRAPTAQGSAVSPGGPVPARRPCPGGRVPRLPGPRRVGRSGRRGQVVAGGEQQPRECPRDQRGGGGCRAGHGDRRRAHRRHGGHPQGQQQRPSPPHPCR